MHLIYTLLNELDTLYTAEHWVSTGKHSLLLSGKYNMPCQASPLLTRNWQPSGVSASSPAGWLMC